MKSDNIESHLIMLLQIEQKYVIKYGLQHYHSASRVWIKPDNKLKLMSFPRIPEIISYCILHNIKYTDSLGNKE